jgi:hypothetical protein
LQRVSGVPRLQVCIDVSYRRVYVAPRERPRIGWYVDYAGIRQPQQLMAYLCIARIQPGFRQRHVVNACKQQDCYEYAKHTVTPLSSVRTLPERPHPAKSLRGCIQNVSQNYRDIVIGFG